MHEIRRSCPHSRGGYYTGASTRVAGVFGVILEFCPLLISSSADNALGTWLFPFRRIVLWIGLCLLQYITQDSSFLPSSFLRLLKSESRLSSDSIVIGWCVFKLAVICFHSLVIYLLRCLFVCFCFVEILLVLLVPSNMFFLVH